MAASWVEICNLGLIALGSQPIASLTEGSNNANLLAASYRALIDEVTVEHEWACAGMRQAINPLSDAPDGDEYGYQYQLPVSPMCLKIRGVDPDSPYEQMGDKLLSNEDQLTLIFTAQITNPTLIPPLLTRAMGMKVAEFLAPKIAQNNTLTQLMQAKYEAALLKAMWADNRGKRRRDEDTAGSEERQRIDEVT